MDYSLLISSGILIFSIILLYYGAEFSLEGSEKVGVRLGLSPLAVGMLLVGFGTSLPEFFVGHIAAVRGEIGIAFGSLIGSNIANMFLILGICGMINKLVCDNPSMRKQLVMHFLLGGVLWFVLKQETLDVITASPLIILCGLYLYMLYRDFRNEVAVEPPEKIKNMGMLVIKMIAGFGMLYLGGELLVKAGTDLGLAFGVDAYVISAIFVAFGTSFPELVTSLIAVKKKKDTDLIIGNIIGSNLFNCAFILGSLGIYNYKIQSDFTPELISLLVGSGFLVVLAYSGKHFYRLSALLFLGGYAYMVGHWTKLF
ncbi:MAG: sodium:calcium antiporter [Bdellovibrionota bacterium]|nr:sodium:calcium antiporter [Bdellovibrionota bacterium]